MEKKLPEALAALLSPKQVCGRRVRLMFQDEARFGRMVRIRRCWAPTPARPVVCNGYEREFVYVYGAVSPVEGQHDWMITRQMNTANMSAFLAQVSAKHRSDFIVMVVDGASSHVCKDLVVPRNIRLLRLPPYAPELNPQEHVWDELREKEFPNRVFSDISSVVEQLQAGLPRLSKNRPHRENLWAISPLQSRFGDCVEKLVQLAARRVERVLFGLGESWPDERAAVFLDHFGDGFIHRHLLELSVIVAPPDELAAQQPEVIAVPMQRLCREMLVQHVQQEGLEELDDGLAHRDVGVPA
jgi:hypothetical protein